MDLRMKREGLHGRHPPNTIKLKKNRQGKAEKTRRTEEWIANKLNTTWPFGLEIRASRIRPSHLGEWLALHELAVNDRIIADSPFERVQKGWRRPEKPLRRVPTEEQFKTIVESIRAETQNPNADGNADFVEFLGLAGLGQAEAASLTWGDGKLECQLFCWAQGRLFQA